jgi:hypothetical protein
MSSDTFNSIPVPFKFTALAADPPGAEGMVYLNSVSHTLRAYLNGAWGDLGSGGGGGAHAATHKAGGADPLLAAPGAIGGTTPAAITGTVITATSGFVGDGSGLTGLPSGGGHAARLTIAFETGGSIAEWQGYPVWTNGVTYGPYGGTRAKGAADFELVAAAAAGDYPVQIVYSTDTAILVTIRKRAANGTWSDYGTQTLATADNRKNFTVTLAAGEGYGLHFAPVGGGSAGLNYFEVWV